MYLQNHINHIYWSHAYYRGLTLILAWISKVRIEITCPFPNFNGCTAEVWELISNLIPTWISTYIHNKVWYEITYPFINSNVTAIGVWEWTSNIIPHFTGSLGDGVYHQSLFVNVNLLPRRHECDFSGNGMGNQCITNWLEQCVTINWESK